MQIYKKSIQKNITHQKYSLLKKQTQKHIQNPKHLFLSGKNQTTPSGFH